MSNSSKYVFEVGERVETLEIILQIQKLKKDKKCLSGYSNQKAYLVKCSRCDGEYVLDETSLKKKKVCSVCTGRILIRGVNDVATTHPHLVKYFANKEDSYCYTKGSGKKVLMTCPNCKRNKTMTPNKLSVRGLCCTYCSDGIPYTEKIFFNLVSQLGMGDELVTQFKPIWSNEKRYDFYIPDKNCIVEIHGEQHYKPSFERIGGRTLEEEQENDKLKRKLAFINGIEHYIELDCRKSELEWIKNSIMTSELPNLLGFKEKNIDWLDCQRYAIDNNLIAEVCSIWNEGNYHVEEIASLCKIDRTTARKYLNMGTTLEMCDYSTEKTKEFGTKKRINKISKRVRNIETGLIFNSAKEVQEKSLELFKVKLSECNIRAVCRGARKHHRSLHFEYVKE